MDTQKFKQCLFATFIITGIEDMSGDAEFGNYIAIIGTFLSQALIRRYFIC